MSNVKFVPTVSVLEGRIALSGATAELVGGVLNLQAAEGYSSISVSEWNGRVAVFVDQESARFYEPDEIKLIKFTSSAEGGDTFFNFTDRKSISHLSGEYNAVVGGTYFDIVIDDGNLTYLDSQNGGRFKYVSTNPDGELMPT